MINSLMISKTGMQAQQMQLDVISNNLANVSTNGFKRANAVFEDLMYQNLRQSGANTAEGTQLPTGLQVGLGVRPVATSRQFTQGNLQQTENGLDVAIQGKGFFQVEMPDGTIGYTRDGSFKLDNQGNLVTNNGYRVLPGFQFPTEATNITIGQDAALDIGRNHTIRIAKDRVENIGNHRHDQIAANHHTRIGGNFEQRVEGHAELEARGDIRRRTRRYELRASEAVVIQGPGGSIRIDETGITLDSPTIRITGQMLKSADGTTSPFSISSAPNTGKPLERLCGRRPDGSCPLPDCRCIRGQVQ